MTTVDSSSFGHFQETPVVELLADGRRVRLAADFGYVDRHGTRWDVPKEAVVDGASIPQPLWSVMGGPFEGVYRAASIVHDWYCDIRSRRWSDVHRMFFEAMLSSGVSNGRAKLMYGGVYWGGPRWSDTVVENTRLIISRTNASSAGSGTSRSFHIRTAGRPARGDRAGQGGYRYAFEADHLHKLSTALEDPAVDIPGIEAFVNQQLRDAVPIPL